MGLTFVGAAGAAAQSVVNTAAAGAARYGTFHGTPCLVRACPGTRHVRITAESSIQGATAS